MDGCECSCLCYVVAAIHKVRKQIGANVREARRAAGWTQEKLAERADSHAVYISQVERGERGASVEVLLRLSKALNVPLASFFREI